MTEFRILGPLEVIDVEGPLDVGSPKERALLAMLALDVGQVVSVDRLIAGLWGEEIPASAQGTLRTYVSHLRRALRSAGETSSIETADNAYRLLAEPEQVDAHRFDRLVSEGRQALADDLYREAADSFSDALALWRGPALTDLPDDDRARLESQRLEELRLHAVEGRVMAELHLGQHAALIPELETLVEQHPLREHFAGLLMTALYQSGRQADALRVYQRTRRALVEELGIEPGSELQTLEEAILNQDTSLDWGDTARVMEHNLPVPLTSFVGRDEEIDTLRGLLSSARLVTLTGPGGSGKTRLALETAALSVGDYPDGVRWVDFASLREPKLVEVSVASVFRFGERSDRLAQTTNRNKLVDELAAYLRSREVLLILDNCEHLVEEVATLTRYLLEHTESIRVLVTTREPLRVPGEHVLRVTPLTVPQEGTTKRELLASGAGQLFVERAAAAEPGFALADSAAVAEICRRLDGIPLALELAAGRLSVMSAADIVERLEDRFAVLTGGARGGTPRHRTLRETLEWSYELLSEDEQDLFRRVSVFSGGFSLEAVEALSVSEPLLENLASLVEKSLVNVERGEGATRYRLLETVRELGREKLEATTEAEEVAAAHVAHFVQLAEQADRGAQTADHDVWFAALDVNVANLRQAIAWAAENDRAAHLRLVGALGWYWYSRGHIIEGLGWLEEALALEGDADGLRARALNRAALLSFGQGDATRISGWSAEAMELSRAHGDVLEESWALVMRGLATVLEGRLEETVGYLGEGMAKAEEAGNPWGKGWALMLTGHALRNLEHFDASREVSAEATRLFHEIGEVRGLAYVKLNMAALADVDDHPERGMELARDALATLEENHDVFGTGLACTHLAALSGELSQWEEAVRFSFRCLELGASVGGSWFPSIALSVLAWVAADRGHGRLAARLYGSAEAMFAQPGIRVAEERWLRRERLAEELPQDDYLQATKEGMAAGGEQIEAWTREVGDLVGVAAPVGVLEG